MDLRITGADQLAHVAKALRAEGEAGKGLRKELYRGIQRSTKPLKQAAKDSAAQSLPQRGGLAKTVASSRLSTKTRGGGKNPGVRIVATGKKVRDVRALDRGRLRHPVFGNRDVWVTQAVKPGWFTRPMQEGADVVRAELVRVIEAVARRVTR